MNNDSQAAPTPDKVPDPFDLDALRINPETGNLGSIRQIFTHIPVRKPTRQQFVRVHPETELPVQLLTLKDEGENFLIAPGLRDMLYTEATVVTLYLAITPQQVLSIWPVVVPGDPPNPWHLSAVEAASYAREKWIRIQADMPLGAYRVMEAIGQLPDPVWPETLGATPDEMMREAIRIAFQGKMINDTSHAVIKRLRGEAV